MGWGQEVLGGWGNIAENVRPEPVLQDDWKAGQREAEVALGGVGHSRHQDERVQRCCHERISTSEKLQAA